MIENQYKRINENNIIQKIVQSLVSLRKKPQQGPRTILSIEENAGFLEIDGNKIFREKEDSKRRK